MSIADVAVSFPSVADAVLFLRLFPSFDVCSRRRASLPIEDKLDPEALLPGIPSQSDWALRIAKAQIWRMPELDKALLAKGGRKA